MYVKLSKNVKSIRRVNDVYNVEGAQTANSQSSQFVIKSFNDWYVHMKILKLFAYTNMNR